MLGENLRRLSQSRGSISQLSRELGINRTQFNRYLSGESFPRPDVLQRICNFFEVDARIILEPVESVATRDDLLGSAFLGGYVGAGVADIPESLFPSGFYRFSRRSFANQSQFLVGLLFVMRKGPYTLLRGYESKAVLRQQDLPLDPQTREYRGYASRHEDGLVLIASRKNAMTSSINYLARTASFNNNFWVGYTTRTVPETANAPRATRLVYEYLDKGWPQVMAAGRQMGFVSEEHLADAMPLHRRHLQPNTPFS
ncbi:helix-turn-helix domain-containing protein [Chachezhania antarctica]|uniref:helix-turn-helix domain-containing protein n=1 Tax=Chachezhania antarctica TaxID=2340860 RepID=UPI000EB5CF81|nr:helix-turn-helix transcriptional regulator [Chachezhania antarctica]|tara:strand:- start:1530 stop:2297 length:768 start_codon:yes stop_codon:yes gene_type:complete